VAVLSNVVDSVESPRSASAAVATGFSTECLWEDVYSGLGSTDSGAHEGHTLLPDLCLRKYCKSDWYCIVYRHLYSTSLSINQTEVLGTRNFLARQLYSNIYCSKQS